MPNTDSTVVQSPSAAPATRWQVERGSDGLVVVTGENTPAPEPADWRGRLGWFINNTPGVAMVGAKRFTPDATSGGDGHVFSFGEFVIHPKGFHHVGKGVDGKAYRFPEECDTIAGGVAVINETTFDEVNGARVLEDLGALGMLGLGLAIRRAGHRVLAAPQVGVVDTFSPARNTDESEAFQNEFGFDWVAPDLDRVRKEHAGQGLVWNAFHHAGQMPFEKYDQRGAMHWDSYQKAEVYRQRADHLAKLVAQYTLPPQGAGGEVVDIGSGDGLFTHLFAMQGCRAIGLDPEPEGIAGAERMCAQQHYPPPLTAPRFHVGMGDAMDYDDNSIGCAVMLDVIEHLGNPIGVLNEAARVLKPGGHLICVTPSWQYKAWSDPVYHGFEFNVEELNRIVNAANGMRVIQNGQIGGVYRDIIAIAQKSA